MKKYLLISIALLYFLLVNTGYFWQATLGWLYLLVFVLFFVCVVSLVIQLYRLVSESGSKRFRFVTIGVLSVVLLVTFFFPNGIIPFERFEAKDVLVAYREGAANCMLSVQLKEDSTFKEKNVCFGISEIRGTYAIIHDTIFFETGLLNATEFYSYGVIKSATSYQTLVLSQSEKDTVGIEMAIQKNMLLKYR